jgi:hypothetical protein
MLPGIAVILEGISATFAMLSANSQHISNFSRIIGDINLNVGFLCRDSANSWNIGGIRVSAKLAAISAI